jgi:hypothetical protein
MNLIPNSTEDNSWYIFAKLRARGDDPMLMAMFLNGVLEKAEPHKRLGMFAVGLVKG